MVCHHNTPSIVILGGHPSLNHGGSTNVLRFVGHMVGQGPDYEHELGESLYRCWHNCVIEGLESSLYHWDLNHRCVTESRLHLFLGKHPSPLMVCPMYLCWTDRSCLGKGRIECFVDLSYNRCGERVVLRNFFSEWFWSVILVYYESIKRDWLFIMSR